MSDTAPYSILIPGMPAGREFHGVKVICCDTNATTKGKRLLFILEDGSIHHNGGEHPRDLLGESDFTEGERRAAAKAMGLCWRDIKLMREENAAWLADIELDEEVQRATATLRKAGYVVKPSMRGKWKRK